MASTTLLKTVEAGALRGTYIDSSGKRHDSIASIIEAENYMIWSHLVHVGFNFWDDRPESESLQELHHRLRSDSLRCDDRTWDGFVEVMAEAGANQVVIDLGEGVRFDSHPDLAVADAWSKDRLAKELNRLRCLGITPIPKLNFSAGHDEWMGEYARMISTKPYYDFCRNLIAESIEMFNNPPYFHIGMDEENQYNQREYSHLVIRQHDLWFSDLDFYASEVMKRGARPWMWSDMMWDNEVSYVNKVSRDIVQSNWYYGLDFDGVRQPKPGERTFQKPEDITFFEKLDKAGFDQIPAGSNYANSENIGLLVYHCKRMVAPERLLGFLQTTWYPTIEAEQHRIVAAVEQLGQARSAFEWAQV